jgi:penicillin-binding protein 1A
MRAGRRRERREPLFDVGRSSGPDIRLDPTDRPGGAPVEDQPPPEPKARRDPRKPANDDRGRGRAGDSERKRAPRKGRAGGGGGSGKRPRRSLARRLAYWTAVLALWGVIGVIGLVVWIGAHLPPIQSLEVPKRPPSVQIVGLDGHVIAMRGEMGGAAVPLAQLPRYLPQAFIAIEDRRFYHHFGIDVLGVARAIVANALHRGVAQGGSTLTQQLAKNLFLTQERTLQRKLQELVLALWLEHKFSKDQILDLYLNRVYFGSGAYGVEAAAQRYFGKSARNVTLAESALLAGLVKSPSKLAPTRNPEGAAQRAQLVLAAMTDAGFISPEMSKVALAHPAQVARIAGSNSANYVADWVMDVLNDLIGHIDEDIVVSTTIDPKMQALAEQALSDELAQKGERYGVGQGALVAMTPDGAVRALVGGRNYADSQYNRAVSAKRQPGSAFKPFVYLTALEHGLTPDTVRQDAPINIKGWRPGNFEHHFMGPVTLTTALAQSLNTVAVRLALEVGPRAVAQTAHRLGIASKLEPNASIALGTSEVSVLELVGAYAPFANGGIGINPHVVERVRSASGKATLYQSGGPDLGRIVDPRFVAMMNGMMQETLTIGTARKADLPGWRAAGKTGTSQDFRDAWFIGYTGALVTGVWLGNDDSSPMKKITGGSLPVEIWSRFMKAALQGTPPAELPGVSPRWPVSPQPLPPAAVASARPLPGRVADDPGRPPASEPLSLDRWLLDKVFGRR